MRLGRVLFRFVVICALLSVWVSPPAKASSVPADLEGHWAQADVLFLHQRGVFEWALGADGKPAFRPQDPVTRLDFAVWLARAFDLRPVDVKLFTDLEGVAERGYIEAAALGGLIRGVGEGRFGPTEPITRAAVATLLSRFYNLVDETPQDFPDVPPTHWAARHIRRTALAGLFRGDARGNFRPESTITRAEAAVVLARALRDLVPYEETGAGLAGSPWPKPKGGVFNRMRTTAVGPAALTVRITVMAGVPSVTVVGTDPPQLFFRPEEPVIGPRGDDVYIGTAAGLSTLWLDPAGWKTDFDLRGLTKSPTWASYKNQFYVALQAKTADGFAPNSTVYALPGDLSHAEQYEKYGRVVGRLEDNYRWKYEVEGIVNGALTVGSDHTLYVATSAGYLYAFHPDGEGEADWHRAGKVRWVVGPDVLAEVRTSPALGPDGTIYVATAAGKLHAFSRAGEQKWAVEVAGPVHTSPAVAEDGTVYLGAADGRLHAFYPGGWEKWSLRLGEAILVGGPSIGHDGTVYVSARDGQLYAVSPTGELLWSVALDSYLSSPVIGGDGTVYVGSLNGRLYALGPGGQVKWTLDPENLPPDWVAAYGRLEVTQPAMGSAPAILADGKLLFRSGGYLFIVWP
ncbi:MAG: PQQ-binding-like beta-propeller repeat protein [Firmicutes bacterium]|nr:PQQ-binding-like beta-propeller repeat protein [Bacillota bacterium]